MSFLDRFRKKKKYVTVVSGLPRSGTSMMMKMLQAGGIDPMTDEIREADNDNPKGYYEFERVKKLDKEDTAWLSDAQGKSVKVITALLKHLPADYEYKVLFMRRDINEVLASQKKMLVNRKEPTDQVSDEELAELYKKHLAHVETWLASQKNIAVFDVSYNQMLTDPIALLPEINTFLGEQLEVEKMVEVVDPSLYRNRQ